MKNGKLLLVGIMALILFTGCSKTDGFKETYKKMEIGKENIGYEVDIKLRGKYNDNRVKQNIEITNYMDENFQVEIDNKEVYYFVDGMKYKSIINTGEFGFSNVMEDEYEQIDSDIPFLDTKIYLNALKKAKADDAALIKSVGSNEYKVYTFMTSKKIANELLKDTILEDVKFKNDMPVEIWIDSNNYVYKIIYDLGACLKQDDDLTMTVTFSKVNNVREIKLNIYDEIDSGREK